MSEYEFVDDKFIRARVLNLIAARNLSDRATSLSLGLNENYINKYRKGDPVYPSVDVLLNICEFFKITPAEFFEPALDDPISARAVYEELKRIGNDRIEQILKLFSVIDGQDLDVIIKIFDKYKKA